MDFTKAAEDAQKAAKEAKKKVDAESDGESYDDEDGLTGSQEGQPKQAWDAPHR